MKETSRKLNKEDLIMKEVEKLIMITLLIPTL